VLTRQSAGGEDDHLWPEILPAARPCCSRSPPRPADSTRLRSRSSISGPARRPC
jgi:hypothetical protein